MIVVVLILALMYIGKREGFDEVTDLESLVHEGKDIMKEKSLVIAGLVRDSAKSLPVSLSRIEGICAMVKNCKVVIVENDSEDSTRTQLLAWRREMLKKEIR